MTGFLLLNEATLGEINFKIIDESMGVIGGELNPFDAYNKYKQKIQSICNTKGIANIHDFDFVICINENNILKPEGGIGITDVKGFDKILVEVAGLPYDILNLIQNG